VAAGAHAGGAEGRSAGGTESTGAGLLGGRRVGLNGPTLRKALGLDWLGRHGR
jgi:hypothetical protein